MRHAAIATTTTMCALTWAGNAFAAGREDTSGVFVWAFLGVCALIIMAQAIPALLMTIGAARGVAEALRHRRDMKVQERLESH